MMIVIDIDIDRPSYLLILRDCKHARLFSYKFYSISISKFLTLLLCYFVALSCFQILLLLPSQQLQLILQLLLPPLLPTTSMTSTTSTTTIIAYH